MNIVKNVFHKTKTNKTDDRINSLKRNQAAIINKSTPFIIQEAYKTARTNTIFSVSGSMENYCKVIAVTSAGPGEGKTTTTINLAITFAQTGARVLIIDGDLRKPRVHQYLGVVKTDGLSTVLSNQKTFDEVVYKNIREGLDLLASGSIPPNPAELLSSDAMGEILKDLKLRYDYIFLDTPPVTVVTDAAALSKFTDGLILIVRQDYTAHENIEQALNLLKIADAKVLGFFVNDVQSAGAPYKSYKNNRYGYRSGYRYSYGGKRGYSYNYRYGSPYGDKAEYKVDDNGNRIDHSPENSAASASDSASNNE